MRDIVDVMLEINRQADSFEAGNVRHEHEWRVWEDAKLPDGKIVIPGVVSHATNVIEHPELVADRIGRYASSWAARPSSRAPIAASAAASIPSWRGRNCNRSPRAQRSPPRSSGARPSRMPSTAGARE